jgi:hypothetical protein
MVAQYREKGKVSDTYWYELWTETQGVCKFTVQLIKQRETRMIKLNAIICLLPFNEKALS